MNQSESYKALFFEAQRLLNELMPPSERPMIEAQILQILDRYRSLGVQPTPFRQFEMTLTGIDWSQIRITYLPLDVNRN